ncbi:MAG: hypothetical protein WC716_12435 [Chitinophagaceae bacterium]|jgi:hypothetical protein
MKNKIVLLTLLLIPASCLLYAQKLNPAGSDIELCAMINKIKMADSVSYTAETQTFLTNEPQKVTKIATRFFQIKGERAVIYTKTDNELFFFNHSGQFKVNHTAKTIQYRLFESDSIFKEYLNTYTDYGNDKIDSFFLKDAYVFTKKVKGKLISYQLKYEKQVHPKEIKLCYQAGLTLPDSVSYTLEQPYWGSEDPSNPIFVSQKVVAFNYRKQIPSEVVTIMTHAKDLLQFIKNEYKTYTLQAI